MSRPPEGTPSPLGLESGIVRVVPYDPRWPELFAAESARLRSAFAAAGVPVAFHHVGSTSIPGLAAKPILDILGVYPGDAPGIDRYVAILERMGYAHRGEQGIPGREFFRRGNPRAYHLHLARDGSTPAREHLVFRDRLRAEPALRDEYARLKGELASRFPADRESYIEGKGPFVRRVLTLP